MFQHTYKPSYLSYVISLISSGNHIDTISHCWPTHGSACFYKRLRGDTSMQQDFADGMVRVTSMNEGAYPNDFIEKIDLDKESGNVTFTYTESFTDEYMQFMIEYVGDRKPPYWPKCIPERYRIVKSKRR